MIGEPYLSTTSEEKLNELLIATRADYITSRADYKTSKKNLKDAKKRMQLLKDEFEEHRKAESEPDLKPWTIEDLRHLVWQFKDRAVDKKFVKDFEKLLDNLPNRCRKTSRL